VVNVETPGKISSEEVEYNSEYPLNVFIFKVN
jgi:hypothetical protein